MKFLSDLASLQAQVDCRRCYQCGKCSAGCPLAVDMDLTPSLVMRLLQRREAGLDLKILRSQTIWLCLNCETCLVRCPMEIDIPVMMDAFRQESLRRRTVHPRAKKILAFHRAFLDSIRYTGRLYEIGMIADYKLRSGSLMQDLVLAPLMFIRGKLRLFPERIRGRSAVRRLFKHREDE